tara:strand:+ start:13053 stop:13190 length:138 start_codon:yes stop_codon:yes gene_type:complete
MEFLFLEAFSSYTVLQFYGLGEATERRKIKMTENALKIGLSFITL